MTDRERDERDLRIIALRESGKSSTEVAREVGVSTNTVIRVMAAVKEYL